MIGGDCQASVRKLGCIITSCDVKPLVTFGYRLYSFLQGEFILLKDQESARSRCGIYSNLFVSMPAPEFQSLTTLYPHGPVKSYYSQ